MSLSISVIIPTYNCASYLLEAIESVLRQTKLSIVKEIIVVDDGSDDNTVPLLHDYCDTVPLVKTYSIKHSGASRARNLGIEKSNAPFIAFLDADDLWSPSKLEVQALDFEKDNALQLSTCSGMNYCNARPLCSSIATVTSERKISGTHIPGLINTPLPSGWVIKKNVFEYVGKFDISLSIAHDADMFLRFMDLPVVWKSLCEPLFQRRLHGSNISRDHQLNRLEIFKALRASRIRKHDNTLL